MAGKFIELIFQLVVDSDGKLCHSFRGVLVVLRVRHDTELAGSRFRVRRILEPYVSFDPIDADCFGMDAEVSSPVRVAVVLQEAGFPREEEAMRVEVIGRHSVILKTHPVRMT